MALLIGAAYFFGLMAMRSNPLIKKLPINLTALFGCGIKKRKESAKMPTPYFVNNPLSTRSKTLIYQARNTLNMCGVLRDNKIYDAPPTY
ncbi:hypothetical protein ACFYU8_25205 [Brevibacillus sp. NPDC003359]|uniref:hypothetical protein n=1 Tax=unclassified Brevibacillus TaxID=2684853 RepID=UPI00369E8832